MFQAIDAGDGHFIRPLLDRLIPIDNLAGIGRLAKRLLAATFAEIRLHWVSSLCSWDRKVKTMKESVAPSPSRSAYKRVLS